MRRSGAAASNRAIPGRRPHRCRCGAPRSLRPWRRNQHGGMPVVVFVGGIPDHQVRILAPQEVQLIELQFPVLRRIQRHAMIERERNVAVAENFTRSSTSFSDDPPVETMTGLRVLAMRSSRNQSLMSELATLTTAGRTPHTDPPTSHRTRWRRPPRAQDAHPARPGGDRRRGYVCLRHQGHGPPARARGRRRRPHFRPAPAGPAG